MQMASVSILFIVDEVDRKFDKEIITIVGWNCGGTGHDGSSQARQEFHYSKLEGIAEEDGEGEKKRVGNIQILHTNFIYKDS